MSRADLRHKLDTLVEISSRIDERELHKSEEYCAAVEDFCGALADWPANDGDLSTKRVFAEVFDNPFEWDTVAYDLVPIAFMRLALGTLRNIPNGPNFLRFVMRYRSHFGA